MLLNSNAAGGCPWARQQLRGGGKIVYPGTEGGQWKQPGSPDPSRRPWFRLPAWP